MLERTESSVLVSLRELGRLEDDRVAKEAAAKQRAIAEAERAQREAAEAAQREQERRARDAANAARDEAERKRLEDAQSAATRDAAVEHARLLAASEANLTSLKAQQEHELRLAEIARAGAMEKWKFVQAGSLALLLVVSLGAWRFVVNDHARNKATLDAIQRAADERNAGVALAQERLHAREAEINRMNAERRAADRAAAEAAANAPSASPAPSASTPSPHVSAHTHDPLPGHLSTPCLPHDPLCGQLP